MIFVVSGAFSQKNVIFYPQKKTEHAPVMLAHRAFGQMIGHFAPVRQLSPVQANFYSANLGFFCRQEIKFEKNTKIPFRFRLGSVEQCDRLENKQGRSAPE